MCMKKSEINLSSLPQNYAADDKFSEARTDDDFVFEMYTWTDEEAKDPDFSFYASGAYELDCKALVDMDCSEVLWGKVDTKKLSKILDSLKDEENCQFEFTIWADGCRAAVFLLKLVASNSEWTYFEPTEQID